MDGWIKMVGDGWMLSGCKVFNEFFCLLVVDEWLWMGGCGWVVVDEWLWMGGCGWVVVDEWLWMGGCG